jgi:CRP-like cAMP-binding protein
MKYVRDHRQVYDIFQVFVLVLTSLHLGACFWVLIINPCGDDDIDTALCKQENIFNLYVESFHLSAVMILGISNYHVIGASASSGMLINETEQVKMYIVSTIYMIVGLCLIAFLISELNVFLFGKKQGSAAFQRKIDRVSYEMEYYGVPDDIQRQVKAFYDYIWIHQKQYDDEIALLSDDQMSTDLQRKLALYLFKDVVSHISLFSEIDDLLLGEICLSLRTRIFLPQDMILFKGDVGKELFIIAKGVVEVLRDDLSPPQRQKAPPILLKSGSFFGEIALIMETRRTCSVQARTICETNILEQDTFDTILQRNPDFAKRMNELVVARQLERSLTKSDEQGCVEDVRVSQVDMANAISAVDKNMKKGLERRLHHNVKSSDFSPENGVFPFKQNNNSVENNANEKICHDMGIEHPKLCSDHMRSSTLKALTSKNSSDNTSANANEDTSINDGNEEFSRIIDDIARRSAQNVHNFQEMSECSTGRKRTNSSSSNDLETGKKLHPNSPPKRYHQNDSAYFNDCDGEDVETMLVTGHFIPDKVMLDIKKVHPTILNGGNVDSSSCSMNKKLRKIETQLLIQEHLMKSILSKMETQNNANSDEAST